MRNKTIKLKLCMIIVAAGMLLIPALSYAQTSESAVTTTISYFYSASGQMIDAEDNNGGMSSYLTRGERYNGTSETFAVSNIKDITADLDSNGNVLNKYTYTAYGTQTSYPSTSNIQNQTLNISPNPFTYDGYYSDSESGNYYLNARYYDPTLGIFLISDSYNLPNRDIYVNGNPVMATDPTGHMIITKTEDGENFLLSTKDGYKIGTSSTEENIRKFAHFFYEINYSFRNSKIIGAGNEGTVFKHTSPVDGSTWAVKTFKSEYLDNISAIGQNTLKSAEINFNASDSAKLSAENWNKFYGLGDSNDTSEYAWADNQGRLWTPWIDGNAISHNDFEAEYQNFKTTEKGKLTPAHFKLNNLGMTITDMKADNFLEVGGIYMPIDFGQAYDKNNNNPLNELFDSFVKRRKKKNE